MWGERNRKHKQSANRNIYLVGRLEWCLCCLRHCGSAYAICIRHLCAVVSVGLIGSAELCCTQVSTEYDLPALHVYMYAHVRTTADDRTCARSDICVQLYALKLMI